MMGEQIVRLGASEVDEERLLHKLDALKKDIVEYAVKYESWFDCSFKIPFEHQNDRPREGQVLTLTSDNSVLFPLIDGSTDQPNSSEEFMRLAEKHGLEYEKDTHGSMTFYAIDERDRSAYLRYYRWRWIQNLQVRRLTNIRAEVFEHFARHPDEMRRLGWRQFEELLDSIFKNQGYRTELGPGRNDGGIDIRLYQSEAIPELVTLVQAKQQKKPIQLEAVAALFGNSVVQKADNALFATTSRFQPKSQMFARTVEKMLNVPAIVLADRGKISEWCEAIARDLNEYFAAGPESAPPPPIIAKRIAQPNDLTGKIVVASSGYNMILNDFAIIEADFAHEVILRRIGAKDVSGDVLQGAEMPDLTALVQDYWKEVRFVAFKSLSRWEDNRPQFWGDRQLWILWDGTPRWFDRLD